MVSVNLNYHQQQKSLTRYWTRWGLGVVVGLFWILLLWCGQTEEEKAANNNKNNNNSIRISSNTPHHRKKSTRRDTASHPEMKILYIITSSNEFNTGDKKTQKGQDRFHDILVPALLEGVESLKTKGFEYVDVYLILGYTLSPKRQEWLVQDVLPDGVGLQIWHDATPLNYQFITKKTHRQVYLQESSRALARQHRYVVKDKLPYYDFILAFEDDMVIKSDHVMYHLDFLNTIRHYQQQQYNNNPKLNATIYTPLDDHSSTTSSKHTWWGNLTMDQWKRIKPGFLRVEVLTTTERKTQVELDPIPVDRRGHEYLDPTICCHSHHVGLQGKLAPSFPHVNQIMIWETAIAGLFVRKLLPPKTATTTTWPKNNKDNNNYHNNMLHLDWVALLPLKGAPITMPGYWSGTDGALLPKYPKKPSAMLNEMVGQSAGWMATRREIFELDQELCHKAFLPPFDAPLVKEDGMGWDTDAVEFWSGGLQLWGQMCNIQRLVSLDPAHFSHHLIYHSANNKQKEIPQERLVLVSNLFGQLLTVQQRACAAMNRALGLDSSWHRFLHAIFGWD